MRIRVATAVLISAAALVTASASASSGQASPGQASPGQLTFDGHCTLSGTVSFSPRMTLTPGVVDNRPSASGTCSGTLSSGSVQTTLTNAPVQYRAQEVGSHESCESNLDAPGTGELIFQQGTLRFQIVENRVSGTADLLFTGDGGGSATGVANVNSSNPSGILEQCAMGGVKSVPVGLTIQTTPSITG